MQMFLRHVRAFLVGICSIFLMEQSIAQANVDNTHFFYIQSDRQQPFYVILNHKVYSSSSIGYLIVPKLSNGEYPISVGFPKDVFPTHDYTIVIKDNDGGYGLKFAENDWYLINRVTKEKLAMRKPVDADAALADEMNKESDGSNTADKKPVNVQAAAGEENNTFASMISQVSGNDYTKEAVTDKSVAVQKVTNERPVAAQVEQKPEVVQNTINAVNNNAGITLLHEYTTRAGKRSIYLVPELDGIDTVEIFTQSGVVPTSDSSAAVAETATGKPSTQNTVTVEGNNPFYQNNTTAETAKNTLGQAASDVGEANSKKNNASGYAFDNLSRLTPTCESELSDKDLEKVKGKMVMKNVSEAEMIKIAVKAIKKKCLTVAQLQSLSDLLLSDAERLALYKEFFDNLSNPSDAVILSDRLIGSEYKSEYQTFLAAQ